MLPTKIHKVNETSPVHLKKKGHISAAYIDDTYLQGESKQECKNNVFDTVTLFHFLGLVAHPHKSVFEPTQKLVILGFEIDSVKMIIKLTSDKAEHLKTACKSVLNSSSSSIREIAQVVGYLVASFPGVMFGQLHYRLLEKEKSQALQHCKGDYEGKMTLSGSAQTELQWWVENIHDAYNIINRPPPSFTIYTDASKSGWGGVTESDIRAGDIWNKTERQSHINYLELLAVYYTLKAFKHLVSGLHIKVLCDNTTAVACLNHMGTSHSESCNALTTSVWEWCIVNHMWITAAHIPGTENVQADHESRFAQTGMEWKLNAQMLQQALTLLQFTPNIDLFASRHNKQYVDYVSYRPDPGCVAVDAFTLDWHSLQFYAFPPFSVLNLVVKKIEENQVTGILVAPDWPTQVWYQPLMRICIANPVILPPGTKVLSLPCNPADHHPLSKTLSLLICHVSGVPSQKRAFHKKLQHSCFEHGGTECKNSTKHTSPNGNSTVIPQGMILFQRL